MDENGYRTINSFAEGTPWLHAFMASYALWGGLVLLVALLLIGWLWARRQPDAAVKVSVVVLTGVATVVALLVNQHLISPAIARMRPCQAVAHVEVLLPCTADYSMPSDHCIIAGAFVVGLWVLGRRFGLVALVLALVLAFARVYAGVHYPSDTIVGLLAGGAFGAVIVLGLRRPTAKLAARIARTPAKLLIESGASRSRRNRENAWTTR